MRREIDYWKYGCLIGFLFICCIALIERFEKDTFQSQLYECQIEGKPDQNFSYAEVRCWIPKSAIKLNGVICLVQHPQGAADIHLKDPGPWIDLAARHGWAFLSICFTGADSDIPWDKADCGSGEALLRALNELSDRSNKKEFRKSPLVLVGVCQAGQFAYEFSAYAPQRVRAFVTIGGGEHDPQKAGRASLVPGFLVAASDRDEASFENMAQLFSQGQKSLAPWAFSVESLAIYDQGLCSKVVSQYIEDSVEAARDGVLLSKTPSSCVIDSKWIKEMQPLCPFDLTLVIKDQFLCEFPSPKVARLWEKEKNGENVALSFCSEKSTYPLTIFPEHIDFGDISLRDSHGATVGVSFDVWKNTKEPEKDVIEVPLDVPEVHCSTKSLSDNHWRVECEINRESIPCGAFKINIPIRIRHDNKIVLGGACCSLTGTISGDFLINPKSIFLNEIPSNQESAANLFVNVLDGGNAQLIKSVNSYPAWVSNTVKSTEDGRLLIKCIFRPPDSLIGKSFSGYFYFTLKSKSTQTVKVLYYGIVKS